jgi:hypothetical protein
MVFGASWFDDFGHAVVTPVEHGPLIACRKTCPHLPRWETGLVGVIRQGGTNLLGNYGPVFLARVGASGRCGGNVGEGTVCG